MNGNAEFIAYCLEEYKTANSTTGKEVIALFKKYNIIDCMRRVHTPEIATRGSFRAFNKGMYPETNTLSKQHTQGGVVDYIISCYGALHTMGGLAIAEDIGSLIGDMNKNPH